ncbi:MAG: ATP-binding protein, partial [Candidatus Sigynarchaeota archaeon]
MFEERAGGYLARKTFFIAVSKREYCAELAVVIFSLNLSLKFFLECRHVFVYLIIITDVYMFAFGMSTIIMNFPIRHVEGTLSGQGIISYKKGIIREYIAILKMQAIDINIQAESNDDDIKAERLEAFMGFFRHQWYYILSQIHVFLSLNIIINNGSYEVFLVLRKRTILAPTKVIFTILNRAINQIITATNSVLECRLGILPHEQIPDVLGKMMFDTPIPRRINTFLINKATEPPLYNTMFRTRDGFITFLRLQLEKYVRSHPSQRINESTRLDNLIKTLITEKITARYMFSIKFSGLEKIELREKDNPTGIITAKVKHGFMEIERNFEYLVNSARISAGLFVFSTTKEEHADAVEKASSIMRSTWETNVIYEKNPITISMNLACNGVESLLYHVPSVILFRFCHLPKVPSGKQERRFQFQLDPPPDSVIAAGMLNIGKIKDSTGSSKDFMLDIDDIRRHVFINGTTGSGKTVFTRNLIEQFIIRFPSIPFLILELKGEYATFGKQYPDVTFLEPGISFSINIFNPTVDVHIHAERIFNILKTSFDFSDMKDFSPQMEKVLVDLIIYTCSDPDPARRNFAAFFSNAQAYVNNNKARIPYLESTWIGIENRLRRITTGPLRNVFDGQQPLDLANTIMKSKLIISLANIISLGGTKDDLYFVANLVLKMVWDANLTRGPMKNISHITLVDDAQYISRTRGNAPARETNFLEDIALLLRGTGEVLVAISTRPDISEDVLSNCGMIVCFQTK